LPDQVGFFCEQAAEKYLKAFLIACGQAATSDARHRRPGRVVHRADPAFAQLQPLVEGLSEFAVIFRYPDAWSDEDAAFRSLGQAEQVRVFMRQKLGLSVEDT